MQPNAAEAQLLWLNIANIAIALVVAVLIVVIGGAVVMELLARVRRRKTAACLPKTARDCLLQS